MITLDTSGIFSLLNLDEDDHDWVQEAFLADGGPYRVPTCILSEVAYLIEKYLSPATMDGFMEDLKEGLYALHDGADDWPRIHELIKRYADLPLGFSDAAVIACAEQHGGRVLTLDWRHFGVVAREGTIELVTP